MNRVNIILFHPYTDAMSRHQFHSTNRNGGQLTGTCLRSEQLVCESSPSLQVYSLAPNQWFPNVRVHNRHLKSLFKTQGLWSLFFFLFKFIE